MIKRIVYIHNTTSKLITFLRHVPFKRFSYPFSSSDSCYRLVHSFFSLRFQTPASSLTHSLPTYVLSRSLFLLIYPHVLQKVPLGSQRTKQPFPRFPCSHSVTPTPPTSCGERERERETERKREENRRWD